ncbi:MAG: bifunctional diaminohydroxyphosphoribosylaminopyrimidine deaminase/5-amino-6-(5-phosphoribosylamino)uracil reductase RibD [Planctomycetota bacterium]
MSGGLHTAEEFMALAIQIARKGDVLVEPNPLVGAVVVRDGRVVGQGYHERFGGPHAEVNALRSAGEAARGSTLYVTLEPCSHHGKTPPCVEAVIAAGVREVVIGARDPNPLVDGKGILALEAAGLLVTDGILAREAREVCPWFFKTHETGTPLVTAKWAMTLDGKIATWTGDSKWITSETSRAFSRLQRSRAGAVAVGIGTVLADDPGLLGPQAAPRQPRRIVVDSQARLPLTSQLVRTVAEAEVWVATTWDAPKERVLGLAAAGCRVLSLPACSRGGVRRVDLLALARRLAELGVQKLVVEGGGELLAGFFEAGLVDRVLVFVAPKVTGGRAATTPVEGAGFDRIAQSLPVRSLAVKRLGDDVILEGTVEGRP